MSYHFPYVCQPLAMTWIKILPWRISGTFTEPSWFVLKFSSASLSLWRKPPDSLYRTYTLAFPIGLPSEPLTTSIFNFTVAGSDDFLSFLSDLSGGACWFWVAG